MLQPAPQTFDGREHDVARIRLAIDIGGTFMDVVLTVRDERIVATVLNAPIVPENLSLDVAETEDVRIGHSPIHIVHPEAP